MDKVLRKDAAPLRYAKKMKGLSTQADYLSRLVLIIADSYGCDTALDISVSSMAWRQGNKAEIMIDGVDYSVNMRGHNFVVYDLENKRLIDSAGFDRHAGNWSFKRRGC